jgi:hypothetical protein
VGARLVMFARKGWNRGAADEEEQQGLVLFARKGRNRGGAVGEEEQQGQGSERSMRAGRNGVQGRDRAARGAGVGRLGAY